MKTKNGKIFLAVLLTLIASNSNAQISFNLKQGVVASTLSEIGNLGDNSNICLSYTAGCFAVVPFTSGLSLQPEVNYVKKGRYEKITSFGVTNNISLSASYLQVPVLVRFTPANLLGESKSKVFFNTGVYESFLLHSEKRIETGDELSGKDKPKDIKNNDFGIVFGGGVKFPFKQMQLQLDLRYDMGLTKISELLDKYNTKGLSLTMGIEF